MQARQSGDWRSQGHSRRNTILRAHLCKNVGAPTFCILVANRKAVIYTGELSVDAKIQAPPPYFCVCTGMIELTGECRGSTGMIGLRGEKQPTADSLQSTAEEEERGTATWWRSAWEKKRAWESPGKERVVLLEEGCTPCFLVSRGNKGVTGEWLVSRGNKGLRGFLELDEGAGRSEMVQAQHPLSITNQDSTVFTVCLLLLSGYYIRNWFSLGTRTPRPRFANRTWGTLRA